MSARTFRLNKLVRDKIIDSTIEYGGSVDYKILSGQELNDELVNKLIEEVEELKGADLSASELADLYEILGQLAKNLKMTDREISQARAEKRAKNGGFEKGHFIDTVTLPADNKWAKYYAADPKRFPEVKNA
jgi:predicted house-cleaning noncanonical NTP pyrophosphatase (MazG superfamily)